MVLDQELERPLFLGLGAGKPEDRVPTSFHWKEVGGVAGERRF